MNRRLLYVWGHCGGRTQIGPGVAGLGCPSGVSQYGGRAPPCKGASGAAHNRAKIHSGGSRGQSAVGAGSGPRLRAALRFAGRRPTPLLLTAQGKHDNIVTPGLSSWRPNDCALARNGKEPPQRGWLYSMCDGSCQRQHAKIGRGVKKHPEMNGGRA